MFGALRSLAHTLFQRWLKRRQGEDGRRITLSRRRIYILPTRFGVMYAIITFTILLAAMNYSNSMVFVLAFLLGALGLVAMHRCHAMLDGLTLSVLPVEPVFAGEALQFRFVCEAASARFGITLARRRGMAGESVDLAADTPAELSFEQPAPDRGRQALGRVTVYSRFPFGLFEAWSWIEPPVAGLVYPAPAPAGAELPDTPAHGRESERRHARGDDDFGGLRTYRPGDSPRHLAWRALAAGRGLYTKTFEGSAGHGIRLDYAALPRSQPPESRLSQLCRWVLDAESRQLAYSLSLPGRDLDPGLGEAQARDALAALALFEPTGGRP